jgi:hypothetical protein
MVKYLCIVSTCLGFLSGISFAQSAPTAERGPVAIWVGMGISTFNPDYGCVNDGPFSCWGHQLLGITPFADADHLIFRRFGAEGEIRFLHWRGPESGFTQSNYLAGPRFDMLHLKRAYVHAKFLVGDANLTLPRGAVGSGNYFAMAPGIAMDLKVTRRISARVDYEYEFWPSFTGVSTSTTSGTGGLTPNGFTIGASYAILR